MTNEAKVALIELSHQPGGRSPLGYGPLSPLARELVAEDCVEIKTHSEDIETTGADGSKTSETREFWYAELTPRGRKLS